jgi:7-cyano-7-deazaguanine synthase
MRRAICLLSGGLDSATTLAVAKAEGYAAIALTFQYGQKANAEIAASQAVAKQVGAAEHRIIQLDLRQIGGSSLTTDQPIPLQEPAKDEIPSTYVPARNTILLSCALALAEVTASEAIYIGINSLDYSGYPDCRPEFLQAFERLANLATRAAVQGNPIRIQAPLLYLSKAQIIAKGMELGVDYGLTVSCYQPCGSGLACGLCESCRLRLKGFSELALTDPIAYQKTGNIKNE